MTNKKKKKGKVKKILGAFGFIGISAGIGFLVGWLSGGLLEGFLGGFFEEYIFSDAWYIEILKMGLMLLVFLIGYVLHIFIHEAGHLIFGLISGYEFVSFRVGSFILIREDGKFKSKRYSIPGTAGQCLMMPPEKKEGNFPFILYNLGGALTNIIVSFIAIVVAMNLKDLSFLRMFLIISSLGGILAALTNAIPLKIGGISNDGHNIMTMVKDKDSRDSFYLQLRVNGLLSKGIRIKDMEYENLALEEGIDYRNPLNYSRIFINHNYHLDNMDFEKAREALALGEKYEESAIEIYRMELRAELLFLELIGDCNRESVEELYDKKLRKYIKASRFMLNKKRIMMAYEILYRKDARSGLKYLEELKELASNYPVKGEVQMELMLGEYLRGKIRE